MEGWDSQDSDQNSPAAVFHPADCRDRVHRSGELGVLARENVPIHTIAFRDVQVPPRLDGSQIILALQVVWHALGDLPRETQNGILHLHVCHGCCASSLGRAHGSFVPQRAVRLFVTFRGGTSSCRHLACGPRRKTAASGTSQTGRSCCSCGKTDREDRQAGASKMSGYAYQTVFAQPKLSIIGLVCRTRVWRSDPAAVTSARYCRRIFAVSVLPAPDSPEMTTDCR